MWFRPPETEEKMADLTVAKTILEQLGGEHFVAMTGSKDFVGTEDSLTFKVGSNPKHVGHVRVTQTPDDLYAVTFFRKGKAPQIMDGICCDILQELFTDNTGLYISIAALMAAAAAGTISDVTTARAWTGAEFLRVRAGEHQVMPGTGLPDTRVQKSAG
jgi:hypothetical protein